MAQSVPMDLIQAGGMNAPGSGSGVVHAGGMPMPSPMAALTPPGVPAQPFTPGIVPASASVAAVGALTGQTPSRFPSRRTEVRFLGSEGMKVSWCAPTPNGGVGFTTGGRSRARRHVARDRVVVTALVFGALIGGIAVWRSTQRAAASK